MRKIFREFLRLLSRLMASLSSVSQFHPNFTRSPIEHERTNLSFQKFDATIYTSKRHSPLLTLHALLLFFLSLFSYPILDMNPSSPRMEIPVVERREPALPIRHPTMIGR